VVNQLKVALSECPDFAEEETALQQLVHDRGHLLIFSPKAHPELAGCGIEYSWGCSKIYYRSKNDTVAANMKRNVHQALATISLAKVQKFSRKARDYRHAYKLKGSASYAGIEKLRKICKTHRCTLDQDRGFLLRVMAAVR